MGGAIVSDEFIFPLLFLFSSWYHVELALGTLGSVCYSFRSPVLHARYVCTRATFGTRVATLSEQSRKTLVHESEREK